MASLQEIHVMLQHLCSGEAFRPTCIEGLTRALSLPEDEVMHKLKQLADLGYLVVSKNKGLVSLTENGALSTPGHTRAELTMR